MSGIFRKLAAGLAVVLAATMAPDAAASVTVTQRAEVVNPWRSGASMDAWNQKGFGTWRGSPSYIISSWSDDYGNSLNAYQFDPQYSTKPWYYGWHTGPIDWSPGGVFSTAQGAPTNQTWADAASGRLDSQWRASITKIRDLRAGKGTTHIRFAHEMNGNWFHHSVKPTDVANFRAAWRRYRAIQKQVYPGARLVFSPGANSAQAYDWRSLWPGDAYVDVLGSDFYANHRGFGVDVLRYDRYGGPISVGAHRLFAQQRGKPLAFPEWGAHADSAGDAGSAAWIRQMHAFMTKYAGRGPGQVLYEVFFNVPGYGDNFQIYPSAPRLPQTAAVYRSLF